MSLKNIRSRCGAKDGRKWGGCMKFAGPQVFYSPRETGGTRKPHGKDPLWKMISRLPASEKPIVDLVERLVKKDVTSGKFAISPRTVLKIHKAKRAIENTPNMDFAHLKTNVEALAGIFRGLAKLNKKCAFSIDVDATGKGIWRTVNLAIQAQGAPESEKYTFYLYPELSVNYEAQDRIKSSSTGNCKVQDAILVKWLVSTAKGLEHFDPKGKTNFTAFLALN